MIALKSGDGEILEVEEWIAAKESVVLREIIDDPDWHAPAVPMHNIMSPVLHKVIEYWNRRNQENMWSESEFARGIERDEVLLFELIVAATSLDSRALTEVACQAVMKRKVVEEVKDFFQVMIKNHFFIML